MTTTLQSLATEAVDDLRIAVGFRPMPSDSFEPRRPRRQRRVMMLAALAVVVVLITSVVAIVGHNRGGTAPAGRVDVPTGYRAIVRTSSGFAMALPATWVDAPPPTGLNAPFSVLSMRDPATGAKLTILAQDVGSTPVKVEADLVVAYLQRLGTSAPASPDASAHVPGYHLTWEYAGQNDAYIIKGGNGRRYGFFFNNTPVDVRSSVMGSFASFGLPNAASIPMTKVGAAGFTLEVPASWGQQPARHIDAKTSQPLVTGGVEATAVVTRTSDSHVPLQHIVDEATLLAEAQAGKGNVRSTTVTFAGQRAVRLDYKVKDRAPNVITPPGLRRIYVVSQGADAVRLDLGASDSARSDKLLGEIAASFKLSP